MRGRRTGWRMTGRDGGEGQEADEGGRWGAEGVGGREGRKVGEEGVDRERRGGKRVDAGRGAGRTGHGREGREGEWGGEGRDARGARWMGEVGMMMKSDREDGIGRKVIAKDGRLMERGARGVGSDGRVDGAGRGRLRGERERDRDVGGGGEGGRPCGAAGGAGRGRGDAMEGVG
ncbi:hypothetical protein Tco_0087207 [Tanacetum coccineum]